MGYPLTPAERRAVVAWLSCNPVTVCPLSRHGLHRSAQDLLDALAAQLPRVPREIMAWHALYWRQGLSLESVARLVGRAQMTIWRAFTRHDLAIRQANSDRHGMYVMDKPEPQPRKKPQLAEQREQAELDQQQREATLRAIAAWDARRAARMAEAA